MTALEKLKKEHPEDLDKDGVPYHCPNTYGYLCDPDYCNDPDYGSCKLCCSDCWSREIPGSDIEDGVTEEMKKQIIEESIVTQKPDGNLEFRVERKILDSGNRRQFESGAVRDIQEGKGRCDLLPLDVVSEYLGKEVLAFVSKFLDTGDEGFLFDCLHTFQGDEYGKSSTMLLEVAKHFEEGAKKYGENNWQKGIPVHCYIDSAVRHYLKFLRGDKDENHDRAFAWNIMCAIWTCKHKPELNEYAVK